MRKKLLLLSVIALTGVMSSFAQDSSVDLSKGIGNNVTFNGTTLSTLNGGTYLFPTLNYGPYKGIKIELSNFVKSENAGGNVCSINVNYEDKSGLQKKARMSFWSIGKKEVNFSEFKDGSNIISIEPASIKELYLSLDQNRKVDVVVQLVKAGN